MTKSEVVELMKSSRSEAEWNTNCDRIKKAHEGRYPPFWYKAIMLSDVAAQTVASWTTEKSIP